MYNVMKKFILGLLTCSIILTTVSCSKDDPIAEVDQEEVSGATLVFTEVAAKTEGGQTTYEDIENPEIIEIAFDGVNFLPPVGAHYHLDVGASYRVSLLAKDFAGRETQQTFVSRAEQHQAFILGAPTGALNYQYADVDPQGNNVNVGVTGYLTVVEHSDTFTLRYVMRHLNTGIKSSITAEDWNNEDFTKFTGDNDLDLKFEVHLTEHDEGH